MSEISFTQKQRQEIIDALQRYFEDELEFDLGQFDADFLLDFITKKIGPAFYNQGIRDAQQVLDLKLADINDELYQIEKDDMV
ncbi:DUF2164 domain-containing protein [Vibrio algarum]|uniref:DUF2164 domain-containing protein n=1 Tax=Vibrio algarum TaxID=3020714 RepID=A0ABT4YXC7_9VIBR|nr:DUF2164 domain-containing protein [Vibrio sp. KJ40-1]MDB1126251.1 DUF2164 domain-containing protein [Vibrio sp. KJ40-1]